MNYSKVYIFIMLITIIVSCKDKDEPEIIEPDKTYEIIKINTSFGDMYMWLYDETPLHKENFLKLTKEEFYNGTTFHRVINDFVIQGGDPNSKDNDPSNDGQGGPGYTIEAEIRPTIRHLFGSVGAARTADSVNPEKRSSGSQFYIVVNENGSPHLDDGYTVFGKLLNGHQVAVQISEQPKAPATNRPYDNIHMIVSVEKKTLKQLKEEFDFVP